MMHQPPWSFGLDSQREFEGKQEHPVLKYRVPHGSTCHGSGPSGPPLPMTLGISRCGRRLSARHWVWRCRYSPPSPAATNVRPPCAAARSAAQTSHRHVRLPHGHLYGPQWCNQRARLGGRSSGPSLPLRWACRPHSASSDCQRRPPQLRRGDPRVCTRCCWQPEFSLRPVHHP